jgi:TonB family protein
VRNGQLLSSPRVLVQGPLVRMIVGFVLLGILGPLAVQGLQSQVQPDVKQSRKLKAGQPPEYPELARQMNVKGIARVMVTISPEGVVKEVKEVGGHPLLLDALVRAVKKWKYEPAPKESVIEVKAEFGS